MWYLIPVALAGGLGVSPQSAVASFVTTTGGAVAGSVDSTAEPLLTAEQLSHYIAVKKALGTYWGDPAHATLLTTAQSSGHAIPVQLGSGQFPVIVFDYPSLVKQDTALASVFTQNHFTVAQFEPTQVAVFHAVGVLALATAGLGALPGNTTTLGQNVALVKAHQQELAAVGVALQVNGGGQGGGAPNLAATQTQDRAQTQQNHQFVYSHPPVLSPRDTMRARLGAAHVLIDYGRPAKRGRAVFGGLVPYGQVWRTGANEATVLQTDHALRIDTLTVPAGEYTLYTIPSPSGWQLIVNKEVGQWGLTYHPEFDLGRVPMTITATKTPLEHFRIDVAGGHLQLRWDTTVVAVPIAPES